PMDKSIALIEQILDTLAYAHQQQVYQMLNPGNIMIRPSAKVVLLNVGLSKCAAATATTRRSTLGTLHFYAPELRQNPNQETVQSDLYAVGVLLCQLLTG